MAYPDGITNRPGRTAVRLGRCKVELSGRGCVDGACAVICGVGAYVVGPNATADPLRWEATEEPKSGGDEVVLRKVSTCSVAVSGSPSIRDRPSVVVAGVMLL